jgi:hypothetical protein
MLKDDLFVAVVEVVYEGVTPLLATSGQDDPFKGAQFRGRRAGPTSLVSGTV